MESLVGGVDFGSANASDLEAQAALGYVTPDGWTHYRAPMTPVSNNVCMFGGTDSSSFDELRGMHQWEAASFRVESSILDIAELTGDPEE